MSKRHFIRMEKIVQIAKEYGIVSDVGYVERDINVDDIIRFAQQIETVVREECAKACETLFTEDNAYNGGVLDCIEAIRTRKA